jgi:rod shape-determining protein MreC
MENLMGRYRNITILAAAISLQTLGLAVQIKRSTENDSSRLIRVWAVTAVTPFEKGIVRLQTGATEIWHNYFYLRGVRQENRQLREQIEQLQLEQVRLKQDADQARRLQALLGFKEQFIAKTTAAQVIGSSGSEQSRTVYIDKGSRDGIKPDMPVISSAGVVGKVISVFGSSSQVLLINDQQSGVGAILEKSRLQGVLKGKVTGELVIDKIMPDEEVKPGDTVVTSGGDQIFPKGLPLGTVSKTTKGSEFLQVTIKPAAVLSHLEEVLVITKREEHEAPVSSATSARAADILAQRLPSVPDKPAEAVTITPVLKTPAPNATSPGTALTNTTASPVTSNPTKHPPAVSGQAATQTKPATSPTSPVSKAAPAAVTTQPPKSMPKPPATPTSKPVADTTPGQQPESSGDAPQ